MTLPTRHRLSGDLVAGKGDRVAAGEMDIESVLVVLSSMQLPSIFLFKEEEEVYLTMIIDTKGKKGRSGEKGVV
jgi:hypothetical protein